MKIFYLVVSSILLAIILTLLPLPHWIQYWRPAWVVMILIYWVMALPNNVGLWTSFFLGLFMDVLNGTLLGEHAFAYTAVAYLALKFYRQLRFFHFWQQAFIVMLLVMVYQATIFIIQGLTGQIIEFWQYWTAALTSFLFWPFIYGILNHYQRKIKLSQ